MTSRCPSGPAISRDEAVRLRADLTDLVLRAGLAILAVDRTGLGVQGKADGSPVTEADLAADRVIAAGLAALRPDIPVVSEESAPTTTRLDGSFFLIDPLDGTKEYIAGRDEFTVNLALVVDGTPLLGIVSAPAIGQLWRGVVGAGTERLKLAPDGAVTDTVPIRTRPFPAAGLPWIAAVSRSHGDARTEAFIDARAGAQRLMVGSAVKFGRIAEGAADIYPRLGTDLRMGHRRRPRRGDGGGRRGDGFRRPSRSASGSGANVSWWTNSSPGAIHRRRCASSLLGQLLAQFGPAQLCQTDIARRIGGEGVAIVVVREQIEPLAGDQPELGVAGHGDPAGDVDRVIAAELRRVDVGPSQEIIPVAGIAEPPDRPALEGLDLRLAEHGFLVGEIGHRVEPGDRQPIVAVHHHALGGRRPGVGRTAPGSRQGCRHEQDQG